MSSHPRADVRRAWADAALEAVNGQHCWTETFHGCDLLHRMFTRHEAAVLRVRDSYISRHGRPRPFKPITMPCRLLPPPRRGING